MIFHSHRAIKHNTTMKGQGYYSKGAGKGEAKPAKPGKNARKKAAKAAEAERVAAVPPPTNLLPPTGQYDNDVSPTKSAPARMTASRQNSISSDSVNSHMSFHKPIKMIHPKDDDVINEFHAILHENRRTSLHSAVKQAKQYLSLIHI